VDRTIKTAPSGGAWRGRPQRNRTNFDERRDAIVDAAAQLFARTGYAATGVNEIGDAVGLARGALYYYIKSKESLLAEIHDRVMDPLLQEVALISSLDFGVTTKLRLVSEALLRQIIYRNDHIWVFLHEYRALTGEHRAEFRRKRAGFEKYLEDLLAQGMESGEFLNADVHITSLAFLGMHNYTYQSVRSLPGVTPEELSKRYCDIFLGGIMADRATDDGYHQLDTARQLLQRLASTAPESRVS
jgi:TetR/AcrR family transcriptional regulator, cholesterol catabolism regulator